MMQPSVKRLQPNDYLFREGDTSRELYIIQSGAIRVVRTMGNRDIELATLSKGAVLGEMALIDGNPRSASAIASKECSCIVVNAASYFEKTKGVPPWFLSLIKMISQKIRGANDRLERMHGQNLGFGCILALEHLFNRQTPEFPLSISMVKQIIPRMIGASSRKLDNVLSYLESQSLIKIDNALILPESPGKFHAYCLFIRATARKQLTSKVTLSDKAITFCKRLVAQHPECISLIPARFSLAAGAWKLLFDDDDLKNEWRTITTECATQGILECTPEPEINIDIYESAITTDVLGRWYITTTFAGMLPTV